MNKKFVHFLNNHAKFRKINEKIFNIARLIERKSVGALAVETNKHSIVCWQQHRLDDNERQNNNMTIGFLTSHASRVCIDEK